MKRYTRIIADKLNSGLINIEKLAQMSGVSTTTLFKIKNGTQKSSSEETVVLISDFLDIDVMTRNIFDYRIEDLDGKSVNIGWKPFDGDMKDIRIDATVDDNYLIYDFIDDEYKINILDAFKIVKYCRKNGKKCYIVTQENYRKILKMLRGE